MLVFLIWFILISSIVFLLSDVCIVFSRLIVISGVMLLIVEFGKKFSFGMLVIVFGRVSGCMKFVLNGRISRLGNCVDNICDDLCRKLFEMLIGI